MTPWVLGAGLAAMLAILSALYFWFVRRPRSETAAGLRALAALRWREVSSLIRQAMQQRGLHDAERNAHDPGEDGSRLLMSDGHTRWLLVCKHGMAYRIGLPAIEELVAAMDLAGARHGILLTQGRSERDAHAIADHNAIEIIDGHRLWPLLKPFMAAGTRDAIVAASRHQAWRHSLIGSLAALAMGLLVAVSLPALWHGEASPPAPSLASAPTPPVGADEQPAQTPVSEPEPEPEIVAEQVATAEPAIEADPDERTQARYQVDVARSIGHVPGIARAYWLTRATLVVERSGSDEEIWPLLCSELERYPSLRTIRVQLNPRPGREEPVRWRQCRTL